MYERAEGYSALTGNDAYTAQTPVGPVYRRISGNADLDAAYARQTGGDMDPSIRAHKGDLHISLNVDGKKMAGVVQKHIWKTNQYVRGPSQFDGTTMITSVDHGIVGAA
jgi:hypothetical protein